MDPRLVRKFVKRIHLALARLEYLPSSVSGATFSMTFHLRSRHFPPWLSRKEVATGDTLNTYAGEYLREHLQRQICFETRNLNHIVLKRMSISPSRPIPVIGWDKYDTSDSTACACLLWPVYLPLYCLPHVMMDTIQGREYLFTIHFTLERLTDNQTIGMPIQMGGFLGET